MAWDSLSDEHYRRLGEYSKWLMAYEGSTVVNEGKGRHSKYGILVSDEEDASELTEDDFRLTLADRVEWTMDDYGQITPYTFIIMLDAVWLMGRHGARYALLWYPRVEDKFPDWWVASENNPIANLQDALVFSNVLRQKSSTVQFEEKMRMGVWMRINEIGRQDSKKWALNGWVNRKTALNPIALGVSVGHNPTYGG